ncbi:MAG TPA: amidophosphoribosyltransferase [Candidatus Dormibacteraeota bacterium]|nr:amidophosphoribosyltransferase [Candidatus Dormibacteraeota bacterium]
MCGIFGIHGDRVDVANLTYFGLFALQHRGQESAGIAVGDRLGIRIHRDMGLVAQVFTPAIMKELKGVVAIGHTRYSTTGASKFENAHPVRFHHPVLGPGAIAHNGNLINSAAVRRELEDRGVPFDTGLDTELMARLIENTHGSGWEEVLRRAFVRVTGAYSCAILTPDSVIALRDPYGFRPLCIGFIPLSGQPAHVIASETCALDTVNATFVREVQPGEMVIMDHRGLHSTRFQESGRHAMCVFEFIYFARPDSILKNCELEEARVRMGHELAREQPVDADMVIGLPDSGTPAAIGYAEESGIPFREGLIKSRYINRTFIQPDQSLREAGVMLKLNPLRRSLRDKRVVAVDDSIVRGTTSRRIIDVMRRAGAREVHIRVSSPPMRFPCFMGVDIGSTKQLVAAGRTVEEVREFLGADSLAYLSIPGLIRAVGHGTMDQFCRACFDGAYPVPVPQQLEMDKMALELPLPPMPVVPAVPPSSTPPVVPTQAASWGAEAGGPSRERGRASRAGAVPRECGRG